MLRMVMASMGNVLMRLSKFVLPIALLLFVANILYVWNSPAMSKVAMSPDEYIFYKTTMNLPNYNTEASWLTDNDVVAPNYYQPYENKLFEAAYTTPIWIHPLVMNYIAYPIAKMFSNPVAQIKWLRLTCVFLIIATVVLFADVIRRRTNGYIAAISIFPMLVGQWLLANGIMFYNDVFMWLFFALNMCVIERKPQSRWIIPLTLIVVLSKMNAILLLIPIGLMLWYKTRKISYKVILPSVLAVVAFFGFQVFIAKDILYLLHHWSGTLNGFAKDFITKDVFPHIEAYILCWGLYISIPLMVAGSIVAIKRRLISYYPFVVLSIITMLYGFAWGWFAYQVYPIMYASMFAIPVVLPLLVNVQDNESLRYELA